MPRDVAFFDHLPPAAGPSSGRPSRPPSRFGGDPAIWCICAVIAGTLAFFAVEAWLMARPLPTRPAGDAIMWIHPQDATRGTAHRTLHQ